LPDASVSVPEQGGLWQPNDGASQDGEYDEEGEEEEGDDMQDDEMDEEEQAEEGCEPVPSAAPPCVAAEPAPSKPPPSKKPRHGQVALALNCGVCTESSAVVPWFMREFNGKEYGPLGGLCWLCGSAKESLCKPECTDDEFIKNYDDDEVFRSKVVAARAAQKITQPEPPKPEACLKSSTVELGTKLELRLRWKARFVTAHSFGVKFKVTPGSVGLQVVSEVGMDGQDVEGVYLPDDDEHWPVGLPYALAEVVTVRDLNYRNLVHDRGDIHLGHGKHIFDIVSAGTV
jgi:hypothetical protein